MISVGKMPTRRRHQKGEWCQQEEWCPPEEEQCAGENAERKGSRTDLSGNVECQREEWCQGNNAKRERELNRDLIDTVQCRKKNDFRGVTREKRTR